MGQSRGDDRNPHGPDAVMQAAWYYYHDDLTQSEVAQRLQVSRATVGRLLGKARQDGLVTITLHPKVHGAYGTGAELVERFGLESAIVVPSSSQTEDITERLASAGSQHLTSILARGQTLAVGWGNTVSRSLLGLPAGTLDGVRVVTLTGGADAYLRALVNAGGESGAQDARVVPAPLLASSPAIAEALMGEKAITDPLEVARAADHAVIGIGSTAADSTLVQLGYLSPEELRNMAEIGVVGDMLGRFYDEDGMVLDLQAHARVIGIDLTQLRLMHDVIAIAGGEHKVQAIKGAIKGGYIRTLITDERTARALLDQG